MLWTILGIEETKDKKAITRAYREKLALVNPEEKPEEFKELRAAYEKALALADQEEKPQEDKTELDLWTDQLEELYNDLPRRLDVDAWRALLSADICQALDSRSLVEEAMLGFFMEHYHISHEVMVYLDGQFSFLERMEELQEKFPQDFLEYVVVSRVRNEDSFPFSLFMPGTDGPAADLYETVYRKIFQTDPKEAEPLLEQLRSSGEKHPYGEALLLRKRIEKGDLSAVEGLRNLHDMWPEDSNLALGLMYGYKACGRMEMVEALADECLKKDPTLYAAKRFKAEAVAARGDYKEAVSMITHLMQELTGDQRSYYELDLVRKEWNEAMILDMQARLETDPEDNQSLYDLIWCLIQNERSDEADKLAEKLPEEQPDAFGYYNVKSVLATDANRHEEALELERKLLAAVDALQPDGTTLTQERMGRRTEVLGRISATLFALGRKDEALELAEQSILGEKADLGSLFNLISMQLEAEHFSRAAELAEMILERDPGNPGAHYFKAYANFRMGRDNIAFDAVNTALDHDGSTLQYYLLKLRILVRNDAYDGAKELIDFLEHNGITEDPTVNYCRVFMFQRMEEEGRSKEEYDEILALAAAVDEKLSSGDYGTPDWMAHFYYVYTLVTADRQDFDEEYPTEPLIAILDRGIAADPDHYGCLNYKGWLLKKEDKTEEALAIYKKLEQIPGHNPAVEENLAEIFYKSLREHAEEALHYYLIAIENEPENPDLHFYAGMCLYRLERPEEAAEHFALEQKYAPEDIDGYYRMAYTLLKLNRLEEAVEQGRKTIAIAVKREEADTTRFWTPLINAYRRLGKTEEAIAAVEDCAEHNPDMDARSKIIAIYLQMGMYKEAQKLVNKKRWSQKDPEGWTTAQTKLLMLERRHTKLALHLVDFRQYIDPGQIRLAETLQLAHKGNLKKYCKYETKHFNDLVSQDRADGYARADYAWALFLGGDVEEARKQAAIALAKEEEEGHMATGIRLMYKCRCIRLLAILGREEEARQACREAEQIPMCDYCEYSGCKDLAIYSCCMEYAFGNYDRALEMARDGLKKWPDEADFIELEYIINGKGK